MELRTYTGLWKVERRLYKFYDINLPYPVSIRQIGLFIGFTIPWVAILTVLGVPFATPWHVVWLVPPVAFAWYSNRPVAEGKTLLEYGASQIGFVFRPRHYAALVSVPGKPVVNYVEGKTWRSETE